MDQIQRAEFTTLSVTIHRFAAIPLLAELYCKFYLQINKVYCKFYLQIDKVLLYLQNSLLCH